MPEVTAEAPPARWGMGDAVLGIVLSLVLSLVGISVTLAVLDRSDADDLSLTEMLPAQACLWVGLLIPVVVAVRRKGASLERDFRLVVRLRDVPIGLGIGLAAQIVIGLVVSILYEIAGVDADRIGETAEELTDKAEGALPVVALVLMVGLAAPVVEELFYRGLWLRAIERRARSTAIAVVASSIVFGAVHFQVYDFVALSLAGLVFAWLAVRFDRLGPAIWAHVAFNLTAVVSLLAT